MKKMFAVIAVTAIGVAFYSGYWPERTSRRLSEAALEETQGRLLRAEARIRLYTLQSRLVDLLDTVASRNFGDAQGKATGFFDAVRAETSRPDQSEARASLEGIMAGRDSLTVALTQSDPAALEMLHGAMARLRTALGEPSSPAPAPAAPAPVVSPT